MNNKKRGSDCANAQADLRLCCSQTPKTCFLVSRPWVILIHLCLASYFKNKITLMSRGMRFQTTWHFDKGDSTEPVQPPFKLRNYKWCSVSSLTIVKAQATWCSVSSLTIVKAQATSKGSDQTAHMRRLI